LAIARAASVPWTEKYRPARIQDVIGNDEAKKQFAAWLNAWLAGRPTKKAALLYGPPGCGKTSLVHAAAKQFDLELIEANASDVRTSEALERRIWRAMTELSLFGKRSKIILLDEIDGINPREDAGGLAMVLKFVENTRYPLVLTANDPWDQRLRELRNKCLMIRFRPLGIRDIVKALGNICRAEGIKCDYQVLRAIAERARGDLRAAINDLQAIAFGKKVVTLKDLEMLGYRAKQADMFEIVRTVLTAKTPEQARAVLSYPSLDYEMLMQWLSENIPYQYSPSLRAIADAYDALSMADVFLGRMKRRQEWSLLPYALHLMTAGVASARERPPFKFVKYSFPQRILLLSKTKGIREERTRIAQAIASKCHVSTRTAMLEILPYLAVIYEADKKRGARILKSFGIPAKKFESAVLKLAKGSTR